jgi:hypothetical protein
MVLSFPPSNPISTRSYFVSPQYFQAECIPRAIHPLSNPLRCSPAIYTKVCCRRYLPGGLPEPEHVDCFKEDRFEVPIGTIWDGDALAEPPEVL